MRSTALRPVSAAALFSLLATPCLVLGCGDNVTGDTLDFHDGSLGGELAVYIADDFEGRSETRYALRGRAGDERALLFDVDPRLTAGSTLKVWGTTSADAIRVTSFKVLAPPVERVSASLKAGMTYAAKRMAFVVVDIGGGASLTQAQAQAELTGPSTSTTDPPLRNYYIEASYGTQDLDGRAFQLDYPMTSCNTAAMASALKPMVNSMGGGSFNHYLWFFGSKLNACAWSGLGEVGTPASPTDDTWYNNSASCVVMVQEPGHNFGMQHSSSMDCGSTPFNDTPNGNCTHSEYGDRYDPMGGGCRHMNGWQKTYNGWMQGCNVVEVRSSGTFTLLPIELPCDGTQLLQIPMPKTRMFMRSGGGGQATNDSLSYYYLELRTSRGVDNTLVNSVHVRVSGDTLGRTQRAVHTWILDMNPTTTNFDGMLAGSKFDDPAGGVTFAIDELDASHATVTVTMDANNGGPTCLGGAAFTAPGPGIDSCSAGVSTPGGGVGGATGTGGATGMGGRGGAGGSGTGGAAGRGGAPGTGGTGTGGTGTGGAAGRGGAPGTGGTGTGGTGMGGTGIGGTGMGGTGTGGTGMGGTGAGGMGTGGSGTGGAGPGTGGTGVGGSASGGAQGTGGGPGTGGAPIIVGTGGTLGTGGSLPGSGGVGVIGTGGSAGPGTGGGPSIGPGPTTGGCACAIEGRGPGSAGMIAFAGLALLGCRRARSRERR